MKPLIATAYSPAEPPAYLANGLIGLRVPQIPLLAKLAFAQGFAGEDPASIIESILPIPYPLGFDLAVRDVWLSDCPHLAEFVAQRLDLQTGELHSEFRYVVDEVTATVRILTVANRSTPTTALQRLSVSVDKPIRVTLRPMIDWRGVAGKLLHLTRPGRHDLPRNDPEADAFLLWEAPGGHSRVGLSYASRLQETPHLKSRLRNDYGHERDLAVTTYNLAAEPGHTYVLEQVAAVVPDCMHEAPHLQASRMQAHVRYLGFDRQLERNRACWAELWQGRIVIEGASDAWQEAVDASFFYLHSSLHRSSPWGIAPFGLSHGNYCGHVFWDYETFMFPAVLLTAPEAARASLDYRSACLPMATNNARLYGHTGVLFPWQSGMTGSEVTTYYNCQREFHINPVVALAFAQYVHGTGDMAFLRQQAWPVLKGVADWFSDFAIQTERGYESVGVASANERFHNTTNDAQFHLYMKAALREAAHAAELLGEPGAAKWREIADALYFHAEPDTGVVHQFERDEPFHGHLANWGMARTATLGSMYGFFPLGVSMGAAKDAATEAYHLDAMWGYMGQPMSAAFCSVWAAMAGRRDDALKALELGTASRLHGAFRQISEFGPGHDRSPQQLGTCCFVTAQGALLTSILLGFCGLHLAPSADVADYVVRAAALPAGWDCVTVERVYLAGGAYRLTARHGERAQLQRLDG